MITYREVHPSVFTLATFPFLFAVMFGDAGHGLIMLSAALFMILREKKLEAQSDMSEIFKIFFGGRYIVFLMSIFSIYTGLIYNDVFSKSLNIFGSHWEIPMNFTLAPGDTIKLDNSLMLDEYEQNLCKEHETPASTSVASSVTRRLRKWSLVRQGSSLVQEASNRKRSVNNNVMAGTSFHTNKRAITTIQEDEP